MALAPSPPVPMPRALPPRVFVTRSLPEPGIAPLLDAKLDVSYRDVDETLPAGRLRRAVSDVDGLLCMLSDRIDAELLDAAPQLRVVANLAVGHDNIDLVAAAERDVIVTNTPDVLTDATADLTWALLLAAARRLGEGDRLVRSGSWPGWSPTQLLGAAVGGADRTLGIVGMGRIGAAVARRATGFDLRVRYTSRSPKPDVEAATGAVRVELDELLAESDIVSLHLPYSAEVHHLLDAERLAQMKPGAILVNTARGALVDEAALVDALGGGHLGAAGLDVYEHEPALAPSLAQLGNVVMLPHLGSATAHARAAMVELACANLAAVLRGTPPITPVQA